MLYTVAYPELSNLDTTFIKHFRKKHDCASANIIPAHFTIVYGVKEILQPEYENHIRTVLLNQSAFKFECKYAMLYKLCNQEKYHIFLVPDNGYSQLSYLHDKLYSGPLSNHLKIDIPYIPHITIATLDNREQAKEHCDKLNENKISIAGTINEITIGKHNNHTFENIASISLKC